MPLSEGCNGKSQTLPCNYGHFSVPSVRDVGLVAMALAADLINNQRNEGIHNALNIPLIGAAVVYLLVSEPFHAPQLVVNIPLSSYFIWLAAKPYYIMWKKSYSPADASSESPVEVEEKSNG
jgi:hypothetical protein